MHPPLTDWNITANDDPGDRRVWDPRNIDTLGFKGLDSDGYDRDALPIPDTEDSHGDRNV